MRLNYLNYKVYIRQYLNDKWYQFAISALKVSIIKIILHSSP